jgi:hypothetical protein
MKRTKEATQNKNNIESETTVYSDALSPGRNKFTSMGLDENRLSLKDAIENIYSAQTFIYNNCLI